MTWLVGTSIPLPEAFGTGYLLERSDRTIAATTTGHAKDRELKDRVERPRGSDRWGEFMPSGRRGRQALDRDSGPGRN